VSARSRDAVTAPYSHGDEKSFSDEQAILIVQAKIQKVPMVNEPEKANAGDSQQRVPDLVPNPLLRVAPGFCGAVDGNQRSKAG
jgi:hypothetical protein